MRQGSADYFELKEDLLRAKSVLAVAEQKYSSESIERNMPQVLAVIWNKAEPALFPSSPKVLLNLALGTALGLLIGIGLAFLVEYLDTSIKTMEDAEATLGLPVLGVIPKEMQLLHQLPPGHANGEAYRILQTNLECNRSRADANAIAVVSGGPGEGRSTTVANLAFTCARSGYSVLIVDASVRHPKQHEFFAVSNDQGLVAFLTSNLALDAVIRPTEVFNLSLLPSGVLPPDAASVLDSRRLTELVNEVKSRFDLVFFDCPPLLGESDGAILVSEVDEAVVVVQHRRYPKVMLKRVTQVISNVGGMVMGAVLNNVDIRHDPNYSFYLHVDRRSTWRETEARLPSPKPSARSLEITASKNGSSSRDY